MHSVRQLACSFSVPTLTAVLRETQKQSSPTFFSLQITLRNPRWKIYDSEIQLVLGASHGLSSWHRHSVALNILHYLIAPC